MVPHAIFAHKIMNESPGRPTAPVAKRSLDQPEIETPNPRATILQALRTGVRRGVRGVGEQQMRPPLNRLLCVIVRDAGSCEYPR